MTKQFKEKKGREIWKLKEVKQETPVEERAEVLEERAFENYIKSQCGIAVENRANEQNFTIANNGAVLPTTIVNRIISTVKEMCPIFSKATIFAVKGTLKVPVYGKSYSNTHDVTVGYQTEFTDITADAGAFTSVDLTDFLLARLPLSVSLLSTTAKLTLFPLSLKEMASKIALFLEKELLVGTSEKATGALSTTNTMNARFYFCYQRRQSY